MAKTNSKSYGRKGSKRRKMPSPGKIVLFLVIIIVIAGIIIISIPPSSDRNKVNAGNNASQTGVKPLRYDADCYIYRMPDSTGLTSFMVEVARDESSRIRGLMYHGRMEREKGMYFIFEREEPRSFWMKNTYIPLDIIFIDSDNRIVSIQKYARPLSQSSLPSEGPAKYVLELNAGLSDELGINSGDMVELVPKN